MELLDRLTAELHNAVIEAKDPGFDDIDSEEAIARAFVRYYAEKLKVVRPAPRDSGYCAAIGAWLDQIDVFRHSACNESAKLIGRLGNWSTDDDYRWMWDGKRLFVRNQGTNEMSLSHVNAWWRIREHGKRKKHPVAPIVEAWVKAASDGPSRNC